MFKKIGVVVCAFFCFSGSTFASQYQDVEKKMWYYNDVMQIAKDDFFIMRGESEFKPETNLKISEAIVALSKAHAKLNSKNIEQNLDEELNTSYLTYAISNDIVDQEILQKLEQDITREEFANLCFKLVSADNAIINKIDCIPGFAKSSLNYNKVEKLYALGIITGLDEYGTFNPTNHITRAEAAVILNRICYPESRVKKEFLTFEDSRYNSFKDRVNNEVCVPGKIFVNSDGTVVSQANLDKLQKEINNFGGKCGFYLVTLDGKFSIGYNIDLQLPSASTVKAPFSLYSMKQIENGNGKLDEVKVYESKHYHAGSGTIQNSKIGTKYTLEEILYYTIDVSDNTGYYMLQDRFGISGYNDYLEEIGCSKMKLANGVRWGYVYPREVALIWNEIYNYSKTSEYGEKLFKLFTNAKYNFIKNAYLTKYTNLPYEIAHKSGFYKDGRHDEAIVLLEDTPYFITITTKPNGKDKTYFNNTALILESIMQEYVASK